MRVQPFTVIRRSVMAMSLRGTMSNSAAFLELALIACHRSSGTGDHSIPT